MTVVTDKQFYLYEHLIPIAGQAIKRYDKQWDNFWIFDGDEGCLTGDTIINVNRCTLGRRFRLDYIFKQFHQRENASQETLQKMWDLKHDTFVRSYDGKSIRLHKIKDVVYSGEKEVWELTLANDRSIKATKDHKIMTKRGWVELQNLLPTDEVMCDILTPQLGEQRNFNQGVPIYCKIKNKKYVGIKKTYDIVCEEPHHNFVANGIVVHNSGKSTFAVAWAYFLAYELGKEFTTKNIFFDLDEMIAYAASTEGEVILWDEAALGGLATQWQNKTQNKLVQALMVARKKRHFWIFCVPKFHELRTYVVRRSIGLVHVYSPDNITRGYFTYYKKDKKNWLYNQVKKTKQERCYNSFSFRGSFTNYGKKPITDWAEYDAKKDRAIEKMFASKDVVSITQEKFVKIRYLMYHFIKNHGFSIKESAEYFGYNSRNLQQWGNFDRDYPHLVGGIQNIDKVLKQKLR